MQLIWYDIVSFFVWHYQISIWWLHFKFDQICLCAIDMWHFLVKKSNIMKRKDTKKDPAHSQSLLTKGPWAEFLSQTNNIFFPLHFLSISKWHFWKRNMTKRNGEWSEQCFVCPWLPFLSPPSSSPSWKTRDLVCSWDITACPQLSMCSLLGGGDASQRNLTPSSRVYPRLHRCCHSHHHHHL